MSTVKRAAEYLHVHEYVYVHKKTGGVLVESVGRFSEHLDTFEVDPFETPYHKNIAEQVP